MNKTARELVSGQQVEWVRPDDLVDQAFQKMAKHDLTALPVVEPSTGTAPGAIKGFVDVVDLVAFLANVGTRIMTNPYGAGESRSIATDDVAILHRRSKEFRITNTVEISDYCKRNPLHKVNQNMSTKDLINFFGKSNEYIHRVAVVDDNHNLIGVLTQSMLLRCIHGDLSQMREINDLKAGSLRMTEVNKLATVPADMVAFDAFMTMHKEGLSSLAVVSGNGEIFENISATDLKGALTDFKRLLLSVRDYLAVTRAVVIGKKRAEGLVYCEREKSLVEVMNRINETRVHRLYVVDEQRKPVGVVSLTDICHSLQRVIA
ncbi:CBS domain containing protein [Acanthamoeba castellanii str. Neff]|uniref:CBS domain containing protein n=1 Tax=Acanthamoeba castellanii (strain ATCC 30010 / Neff) TaxID=1257118 RepID=L8GM13_ACACF|nr:CBS domain containing protein [Acanthamoeba castellanii str. Neff]ELR13874.1 CBS domain containing protein [Acanthamoeba castellanii str. Neff]